MDIFRIVGLGLAAAILAVFVKNWRAEIAIMISVAAAIIIFLAVTPYLKAVLETFEDISNQVGLDIKYITVVLKVIGIAYVTQFGAELCRDAGESAIATKIEFGGKVIIMALSMPIMYQFLEVVDTIIRFD